MFYDIFRIVHKTLCRSWISIFVLDIIYWVIMAFVTFSFLLLRCKGEIRAFVLLGLLCGFIICRYTLSAIFMLIAMKIIKITGFIICLIKKPLRFLKSKILKLLRKFSKTLKKLALGIKNYLKHGMSVLYNYHVVIKNNKKINRQKKKDHSEADS